MGIAHLHGVITFLVPIAFQIDLRCSVIDYWNFSQQHCAMCGLQQIACCSPSCCDNVEQDKVDDQVIDTQSTGGTSHTTTADEN